jgi:hypothetical protein
MTIRAFWSANLRLIILMLAASVANAEITDYPRSDDHLLVEFQRYTNKLAIVDYTPSVRLYGSGRLVIYFPQYMQRAGEYEAWLTDSEVLDLLNTLEDAGVTTLTSETVAADAQLSATIREAASRELRYRSEVLTTQFTVDLDTSKSGPTILRAENLQSDAEELNSPTLDGLATAERALLDLMDRADLTKTAAAKELRQ